jgi:ectoine hydroxylase-related dioxygenase (phytanoyl-CoA dioxygenase family)
VLKALEQLYYRKPLPFQTLNFPIGTEQKVHSDDIHFSCDPPTYMCGVWVALEDIDMQNGPLVYYPGSHRSPVVRMEQIAPGPGPQYYSLYEDYIAEYVAKNELKPHYAILPKGHALIWASNLLHGGSVHRDKGRTRHSQVTHYFFEGCQYFTPLCSYGGYRHLRKPDWIPTA